MLFLRKKRSRDLAAVSETLAPRWLSQGDQGAAMGQGSKKAGTSGTLQPVLPTDHHGSAQRRALSRPTAPTRPLQRTVGLLFWVKVPIIHHIYLDSPTQAAVPPWEEGPRGEPPRPSWCAGAGRGARGGTGSEATGRDKKDQIKSSGQSIFHFSSGITSHLSPEIPQPASTPNVNRSRSGGNTDRG